MWGVLDFLIERRCRGFQHGNVYVAVAKIALHQDLELITGHRGARERPVQARRRGSLIRPALALVASKLFKLQGLVRKLAPGVVTRVSDRWQTCTSVLAGAHQGPVRRKVGGIRTKADRVPSLHGRAVLGSRSVLHLHTNPQAICHVCRGHKCTSARPQDYAGKHAP